MKSIQIISILISMLVIMITPAYADQLEITQYSGTDKIDGYAQSNDQITIKVTATMYGNPTTEVAARRLQAKHSGMIEKFSTCATYGQNTYKCEYTTTGLYAGTQAFTIELLSAEGNILERAQKTITIDNLKPAITEFEINPKRTSSNKATVSYKAEDYLRTTEDTACSGIKEVQFLVNNQKIAAETGEKEQCFKENTFDYTRQVSDYEKITVCAKAVDYVGQESSAACTDYEIDQKPPVIKEITLKDADGFDLTGIRSGVQLTGSVEAIVEGNDEDIATVTADLSSINPSLTGQKTPDEIYGTNYIWRGVQITNPSGCQITVIAVDDLGNEARQTKQCSIPTDDLGPEPVKIETNFTDDDGTYLIGTKGTIKLEIREPGAGLFRKNAYMDLSKLGARYSTDQRADECHTKTGDVWECSWTAEPSVPNGDYIIKTRPNTRDDLNNPATRTEQATIRVDRQPPTIEKTEFSVQHAFAQYGDKAVRGDVIEYKIQTKGTHTAYSNFTGIGGSYAPGTCSGNETKTCEFSQTVLKSGPNNATISFDFYDRANNLKTYRHNLAIYGIMNETTPEYWNSTVTCSPSLIDRSTTTKKEQTVYCHIKLTSTNTEVKPVYTYVDRTLSECTPQENLSGAIAEIQMMNNGLNSKDPYLAITLSLADFSTNEISFSCPVYVSSRVGNYFARADEKEMINVKLEFYNLPIREIYDNIERDINHEIRKSMAAMKWIDDTERGLEYARGLCGIKSTFSGILGALDAILGAFIPILAATKALGNKEYEENANRLRNSICNNAKGPFEKGLFGGKKEEGFKTEKDTKGLGKTEKGLWQFLDMMCDFLNCKLTWDETRYDEISGENSGEKKTAGEQVAKGGGDFLVAFGGGGIGGKNGVCRNVENFLSGDIGIGKEAYAKYEALQKEMNKPGEPTQRLVDVKESIFWSAACQCVPGIIHNIAKIREINCRHAVCLAEEVKKQGIDPSWCRAEKAYLTCTYVMGEIFAVFPFVAIFDKAVNTIKEWFENPIMAIAAASGCACGGCIEFGIDPFNCDPKEKEKKLDSTHQAIGYIVCILPKTASKVMDAYASAISIKETAAQMKTGTAYCDRARELGLNRRYSG